MFPAQACRMILTNPSAITVCFLFRSADPMPERRCGWPPHLTARNSPGRASRPMEKHCFFRSNIPASALTREDISRAVGPTAVRLCPRPAWWLLKFRQVCDEYDQKHIDEVM